MKKSNNIARAAYIAGTIDSDGHICWRAGKYNAPNVGVTNTNISLINWLKANLGGSVSLQRVKCHPSCRKKHPHKRNNIYKWHITGYRSVLLLESISQFLIIKGDKAKEVIQLFWSHLETMERPERRKHHIKKELDEMKKLGWV